MALSDEGEREDEEWIFWSSKDANLLDEGETRALFERDKPTHVIHLAAALGGIVLNMNANLDFFNNNMKMAINVLKNCHRHEVKKVLSCLSTCAFPDKVKYPFDESKLHDGLPHGINFGYSYAKRMIDVLNKAFAEETGNIYTSLIPCNIFGPYDNFKLKESHVIPGLIHKAYIAQKENKLFEIWGTGQSLRQFIYSKDFARLVIWATREYEEVDPIILCNENEMTIQTAATMILEAMKFEGGTVHLTDKPDGRKQTTASNTKMRKYLPDFKFTPMKVAITETVQWFVENYDSARK